ncbi:hypothetical protein [Nonomuraea sp. SYSU D8015]|uniref:hypothetical protein n=1 Tax=Nonomuraea sp. SYSU D8015 TaxID=2593644 RepID=UPI0016601E59|nr:hypothetical protein [Nonomuraea sp. SYSU D8015]
MALFKGRWSEERFEEWFQARFDRWIDERFSREFDERLNAWADGNLQDRFGALFAARFDEHMRAWADSQFRDRFEVLFTAGFDSRITAWKDAELKKEFDAWVAHWFDNLFKVWANTWADGADFRERFVQNFVAQLQDRLDSEVKARVANEIYTQIDRRIEQWLLAVRRELLEAAPPSTAPALAQPADDTAEDSAQQPALSGNGTPPDGAVATAAELAAYLAKGPLQPQQIRKILKGKEIPGRRPNTYPLGEAASALLLRKGRQAKASEPDAPKRRRDTGGTGGS